MSKSECKTMSKALNVAKGIIVLLLAATVMIQSEMLEGAFVEQAYAETASSHSIAKKVGTIAQYDNGEYVHDFTEGVLGVNGEVAFCMDPNIAFKSGTVSSADIFSLVSPSQLTDISLRAHFVRNVYQDSHLSDNARVILAQTLVWEVISPNQTFVVVAAEDGGTFAELTAEVREDVLSKARAFASENASRYESFGTLWVNGDTQPVATFGCRLSVGIFDLLKLSSNPSVSKDNDCYSLEGAIYGIYSDSDCTVKVGQLVTDKKGYAKSKELRTGTYYVREDIAPKGFKLDAAVHPVNVSTESMPHLGGNVLKDDPLTREGIISIEKHDAEIDWHPNVADALGGATVEGAKYRVEHYGGIFKTTEEACASGTPLAVWEFATDATGRIDLSHAGDYLESGSLYYDASGKVIFPLGTYVVRESQPSKGYLLSDEAFAVSMQQDGSGTKMIGQLHEYDDSKFIDAKEQVKRCDITLTKVRESDMKRLAGIPFALTSKTTGESHVLVTDENGYINTASSWISHSDKTNQNDNALDEKGTVNEDELDDSAGIWFGLAPDGQTTQVDDLLGALPYDTYTLEELPCSANAGLVLVKMENIAAKKDSVTIDLGTIDDKESDFPSLTTIAYDSIDMDKHIAPDESAHVIDKVELDSLVPGRTYTLYGTVVDSDTGLPALSEPEGKALHDESPSAIQDEESQKRLQEFWEGLLEVLGAERQASIEGYAYEIDPDFRLDAEKLGQYMAEHDSISSRMMVASREIEADSPRLVTSLDYEMDTTAMEGEYVIYDLLLSDDGAAVIHADTRNEKESFDVEQPDREVTQDQPEQESPVGKSYYKTGIASDGGLSTSGMMIAGTAIGTAAFVGRRFFWTRSHD